MDAVLSYFKGSARGAVDVESILDSIADQVLGDGNVEKALQRAFRFGTEDDIGLLDILDRLREEIQESEQTPSELTQHDTDQENPAVGGNPEDATAMRDALRQVESLEDLQGLDPELMDRTLSTEEREWVEKWADMTGQLLESGLVAMSGNRLILTAKAIRQIGSKLLQHLYLPPTMRGRGNHLLHRPGLHGLVGDDSSTWEWGRPLDINVVRSIMNAVRHSPERGGVYLTTDDFEVNDRESGASIATVLLSDMSRSMFESGAWDVSKRAAIALNTLISTNRQNDELILAGFSGDARVLRLDELPSLSWDQFSHGTNLHAGLLVASRELDRFRSKNRQVVIITDGEPTAFMDGDKPTFEHPVTDRTIDATMLAAKRMERSGIAFTTICVGSSEDIPEFARTMSRAVNGRLIQLPLDKVGSFVVRDVASGSNRLVQ